MHRIPTCCCAIFGIALASSSDLDVQRCDNSAVLHQRFARRCSPRHGENRLTLLQECGKFRPKLRHLTMLFFTPNRRLKSNCTNHCTIVVHSCPTTMISDTHRDSILLKTFGPQTDFQSVAPNVAGSSPVSHPNFPAFLITSGFAHLLRHIGSPTLAVGTWTRR